MGIMLAVFRISGISPVSKDLLQMRYSGLANECLHDFKSNAGNLSGPAAAVREIWSMASVMLEVKVKVSYHEHI